MRPRGRTLARYLARPSGRLAAAAVVIAGAQLATGPADAIVGGYQAAASAFPFVALILASRSGS